MSRTVVRKQRRRSSEPKKTPECSREKALNWFRFWFQVDLGFLRFVTAIGTQGAISKETKKPYFVRSYKVDVSSTGEDWVTVKDNSKPKVTFAPRESRKKPIVASAALFPKLPRQRSKQLEPFPRRDPSAERPLTFNPLRLLLRSSQGTTTQPRRPSPGSLNRLWPVTSASAPSPGSRASACASRSTAAGRQVACSIASVFHPRCRGAR